MSRIADRAHANKVQESDRTPLAQHGAGRPVTTLPAITLKTAASSSVGTAAMPSAPMVLKSEEFPPIDPNITNREARRKLIGDRQTPMTTQQLKRLNRSTLPPEQSCAPAAHPKSYYTQAREEHPVDQTPSQDRSGGAQVPAAFPALWHALLHGSRPASGPVFSSQPCPTTGAAPVSPPQTTRARRWRPPPNSLLGAPKPLWGVPLNLAPRGPSAPFLGLAGSFQSRRGVMGLGRWVGRHQVVRYPRNRVNSRRHAGSDPHPGFLRLPVKYLFVVSPITS